MLTRQPRPTGDHQHGIAALKRRIVKTYLSINRQLVFALSVDGSDSSASIQMTKKRAHSICGLFFPFIEYRIRLMTVITRSLNKQSMLRYQMIANAKTVAPYNSR